MASQSSIQFIDDALFCTSSFPLAYADPDQKWLIQLHLNSLLRDFPSLRPSRDTFTHNTGARVNLLIATGDLPVSHSSPPVSVTVWLHENYPHMAPMVFVSPKSVYPIHLDHPYVDPCGATTSPYLQNWLHPISNLSGLVHSLVELFSNNHPFYYSTPDFFRPSLVSKIEAIDRLSCSLQYDLTALRNEAEDETKGLAALRVEMDDRIDIATSMIVALECEEVNLETRVKEMRERAGRLVKWLRDHEQGLFDRTEENAFEALDEESRMVIDCLAADRAMEDLMYALDKAVEQGILNFGVYTRQVRILAREQFTHRAMAVKLRGFQILNWSD